MVHDLINKKCIPCEGGTAPLDDKDEDNLHAEVPSWGIRREGTHCIDRKFKFKDFRESMAFVNDVAKLAESEGHHPKIEISWNKVRMVLFTHAMGGLSENDFIMAAKIDRIYGKSE